MLNLYYRPTCPYCARVLLANATIEAPLVLRNIATDAEARAELIAKGGKAQVPYLEDTDRGVAMYESEDIITYLHEHYSIHTGARPIVPAAGNVCPIE